MQTVDTILYIRVSSEGQNTARQEKDLQDWAIKTGSKNTQTIIEKVSGTVKARNRQFGKIFSMKGIKRVVVEDLDRLGRDTVDILQTINELTDLGISVTVTGLGVSSLNPDGTESPAFKLMSAVLASLAEIKRKDIKKKTTQGIKIRKAAGGYTGRKIGATKDIQKYKKEYKSLIASIKTGSNSLRNLAKIGDCSVNTVKKLKTLVEDGKL